MSTFLPSQTCNNWLHCHPKWKTSSSNSSSKRHKKSHAQTMHAFTLLWLVPLISYNQLCTHHIALFDTVAAPQHTRPVALPVSPFWFFGVILKSFIITVSVLKPPLSDASACHTQAGWAACCSALFTLMITVLISTQVSLCLTTVTTSSPDYLDRSVNHHATNNLCLVGLLPLPSLAVPDHCGHIRACGCRAHPGDLPTRHQGVTNHAGNYWRWAVELFFPLEGRVLQDCVFFLIKGFINLLGFGHFRVKKKHL